MKKKIVIIISIIVVLLLGITFTKALYTSSYIQDYYLNSKGFYFETDYDKNITVNNFWDGNQIEFELSNSKKDKYTEDDIKYEIKCIVPKNATCSINGSSNKYESKLKGKEISKEKIYLNIESNNKDTEVDIIIKSISPYKKTIKKELLLHKDEDQVGSFDYEIINYDNYSILNISNYYNQDKCFNIKWNNKDILVSVTEVNVITTDSDGYVTEFTKKVLKNETASIKFYNRGKEELDKGIFKINECSLES